MQDFFVTTSVNPKEGCLYVMSVGMGVASSLTLLGSHIIMGEFRTWKLYLGMEIPYTKLGTNT